MIGPFIYGIETRVTPPQLLILLSVRNGKKYGYEILKDLRAIFEDAWEPKTGAIYPAIKRLQENGLLISDIVDGTEYYELSEAGKDLLIQVLPKMGALISVASRFTAFVDRVRTEFGLEASPITKKPLTSKESKLRHLREMREHFESNISVIDETIKKIEEGKE